MSDSIEKQDLLVFSEVEPKTTQSLITNEGRITIEKLLELILSNMDTQRLNALISQLNSLGQDIESCNTSISDTRREIYAPEEFNLVSGGNTATPFTLIKIAVRGANAEDGEYGYVGLTKNTSGTLKLTAYKASDIEG